MKFRLTKPDTAGSSGSQRRWPEHLFNGRIRTSTVVLILAFGMVWWVYATYRTEPEPPAAPQVVPPGFIPDPAYTWVPRTKLQQPPATPSETPTPTTTATEPPPGEPPTSTPVPGFPFCPPLCPPPAPVLPEQPGQSPAPGSLPAAEPPGAPTTSAPPGPVTSLPAAP